MTIYHLASQQALRAHIQQGHYAPPGLETEGFLHASPRSAALQLARDYFEGVEDLLLVQINEEDLGEALRWEEPAPREDAPREHLELAESFPHLYGPLPLTAINAVAHLQDAATWPTQWYQLEGYLGLHGPSFDDLLRAVKFPPGDRLAQWLEDYIERLASSRPAPETWSSRPIELQRLFKLGNPIPDLGLQSHEIEFVEEWADELSPRGLEIWLDGLGSIERIDLATAAAFECAWGYWRPRLVESPHHDDVQIKELVDASLQALRERTPDRVPGILRTYQAWNLGSPPPEYVDQFFAAMTTLLQALAPVPTGRNASPWYTHMRCLRFACVDPTGTIRAEEVARSICEAIALGS